MEWNNFVDMKFFSFIFLIRNVLKSVIKVFNQKKSWIKKSLPRNNKFLSAFSNKFSSVVIFRAENEVGCWVK